MLKALAVATAVAGVLATASPTSAAPTQASDGYWPSGNCPQGVFCLWPETDTWVTPALVTNANWSGQTQGWYFYNNTSRNVDVIFHWRHDPSWGPFTVCLTADSGRDTYWPGVVTKVEFHTRNCI